MRLLKKGRYKDKYIVSISSSSVETLSAIAKELIDSGYSVDVGLMQINSVNFEPDSVEDIFDLDTNIKKQYLFWLCAKTDTKALKTL